MMGKLVLTIEKVIKFVLMFQKKSELMMNCSKDFEAQVISIKLKVQCQYQSIITL